MKEKSEPEIMQEYQIREGIKALVERAHGTAVKRGWYLDPDTGQPKEWEFGTRIALMHSELSESLEAHRKDLMDDKLPDRKGYEVELADCIIRICDLAGHMGLDLAGAILEKDAYNRNRHDHSLESRKAGGKKY